MNIPFSCAINIFQWNSSQTSCKVYIINYVWWYLLSLIFMSRNKLKSLFCFSFFFFRSNCIFNKRTSKLDYFFNKHAMFFILYTCMGVIEKIETGRWYPFTCWKMNMNLCRRYYTKFGCYRQFSFHKIISFCYVTLEGKTFADFLQSSSLSPHIYFIFVLI